MNADFKVLREDFPMLKKSVNGKPLVYLDSAATAQKPQAVIDAISQFYQNQYGTVHRAIYHLSIDATRAYEETRTKVRKLIHAAKNEEIIFTRGTTEAINLVALSFGQAFIQPGDEVIISEMEHHSNIVPWQILCTNRNAVLKIVPMNEQGVLSLEKYEKLLTARTKLVSISHIANATGTLNPIKVMIDMAHKVGAKFIVDGAQSVPHMPVDVQAINADFYAFSGHKLYGPTGIGILYGKESLLNEMPPHYGGGDMIETVTFENTTYNNLPLKFEAGTPLIAEAIGLGAAIDYVNQIGLGRVFEWEKSLLEYATELMNNLKDVRIIGNAPEKGAILTFIVNGIHSFDLGTLLDFQGIAMRTGHLCAQPTMRRFSVPSFCRVSFAFYNTKEEIEFFVKELQKAIHLLKK